MTGRHEGPRQPFWSRAWPWVVGAVLVLGPVAALLVALICSLTD